MKKGNFYNSTFRDNDVDVNTIEREILQFWKENKIFEESLKKRKDRPVFSFFDGPPFATGLPHYGHILASVLKDLYCRYATMRGFYVPRRWGWDCHGLPIEILIEQKLDINSKKEIEKIGVEKFNRECRETVLEFAEAWGDMVDRIGRWIEFKNAYKTMDTNYIESVWWAFKILWEKKLIYEDKKPLLYCPRCQTVVSKFEIAMDKNYKERDIDSIIVKFKVIDSKARLLTSLNKEIYFLVWTTTPWTLPANVAIGIKPDLEYLIVEDNNHFYIIGKKTAHFLDDNKIKTKKTIEGRKLIGIKYEPLFKDINLKNAFRTVDDPFISETEGTGLVHLAPAYGEEDFKIAKKEKLPVIETLNEEGKFQSRIPSFLEGIYFEDANKLITDYLSSSGALFKIVKYKHKYPFCWRCGTPLYYRATPSLFINIKKIKNKLIKMNEGINWHPTYLKYGRFLKSLKIAPDWNISRMRYWASPIPLWRCSNEACNEVICIGSVKELQSLASNFEEVYKNKEIDLHRPYVDKLLIRCKKCNSKMIRIKEVLDCWFESASMPFAELHYPFENERRFQERYPADFVAEYIAQTRAWFYVMLVVNGTLFGKPPFKNVIATGTILSESGEKLSKSKRNFPDPWIMIEKYGADALRLYLLSSQVVDGRDLFFSENDLKNIFSGSILKILNLGKLYKFYNISSIVEKNKLGVNDIHEVKELINKWVLSFIYYKKNQIKQKLDNYETQKACREVINLIDEISLFYVKYAKELIKNEDKETSIVFTWVLYQLSKIIAPVMPFMGEYLYKLIPFQREKSIHLEDFDDLNYPIDDVLLNNIKLVKTILNSGLSLRKENRIKLRYPVRCIYININLDSQILRFIKKALNAKAIMVAPDFAKLNLENLLVKENETIKIAMDRILDSDLISEGLISDLIRCINNVRKKLNLYPGEQAVVDIFYDKETSSQIPDIIKANIKKIMSATYSKRIRIFDYFPEEEKKCFEAEIGLNKKHRVRIKIYKGQ